MNNLPSRRYVCKVCKRKGRRNNSLEDRSREPVCPSCERSFEDLDRSYKLIPIWIVRKVSKFFLKFC